MPHILVIDDEPTLRDFMAKTLTRAGHSVKTASNGAEAFRVFTAKQFDLIITDIFMPEGDGVEVLINSLRDASDVPVLVVSGGSPGIAQDYLPIAKSLGAKATLAKPFTAQALMQTVDALLMGEPPPGSEAS